jgi:hypothetical protein|tara:strand:+ start:371 stop:871 length:501 start_codon:yes stop_codon:yes gene_type:complete
MNRRIALKRVGLIAAGFVMIPYACNIEPEIIYSNLPRIKKTQQQRIGYLSNIILSEDSIKFPTTEPRQEFVLTMVNDCYGPSKIKRFSKGFEMISTELKGIEFEKLSLDQQISFLDRSSQLKNPLSFFIETIKKYSLLHFESSENYMIDYLNFEFIPGRYLGSVSI